MFASMIVRKARFTPTTNDTLPRFTYHEEELSAVISRAGGATLALFAASLLLGAAGLGRLRRYRIG
jgi:hypothetical protein